MQTTVLNDVSTDIRTALDKGHLRANLFMKTDNSIQDAITAQVGLHAMAGQSNSRTLHILGKIGPTTVQVLIEGVSPKFHPRKLANFLGIPKQASLPYKYSLKLVKH